MKNSILGPTSAAAADGVQNKVARMTRPLLAAIAAGLLWGGVPATAQSTPLVDPQIQARLDGVKFEQDLVMTATALAVKQDIAGAWNLLVADGAVPGQVGFRLVTVAGALRNQNKGDEAVQLTQLGLSQGWCDLRTLRAGKERGDVSYWCAWLSAEIVGDGKLADRWAAQAEIDDPGSDRVKKLRRRVGDAQRAFPGN